MIDRTNPKYKYLKSEEFVALCSSLLIDLGRRSEEVLETYEQHDLILPVYRLHIPENYKKIIFQFNYAAENERVNTSLPDEYIDVHTFINDRLKHYSIFLRVDQTLSDGHPLDWAYRQGKSFIEKPSVETFKPWSEYKIVEGEIYGNPQYGVNAEHYYAQWQVFLFQEIDECFLVKTNPFLTSRTFTHSLASKADLSLLEWTKEFEIVAEYRFKCHIIFEKYIGQTGNNILEGSLLESYYADTEKLAEIALIEISEQRLIEFLRKLCGIYFDYKATEKIKLSQFLKRYIYSAVDIYLKITKKPYIELLNSVGWFVGGKQFKQWYPLEIILPDEEREKKRARDYFISLKDKFNSIFPSLAVSESDIDEIVEQAVSNGNEALLTSVVNINKKYRKNELFRYENIWENIRTLSTAVETFGKEKFQDVKNLSGCIDKANSKNQNLRRLLNAHLKGITDATEPAEFLSKFDIITNPSKHGISVPNNLLDLKYLLLAHLTRNFASHSTKIDIDLFGSCFKEIYKALIFTIFYLKKC